MRATCMVRDHTDIYPWVPWRLDLTHRPRPDPADTRGGEGSPRRGALARTHVEMAVPAPRRPSTGAATTTPSISGYDRQPSTRLPRSRPCLPRKRRPEGLVAHAVGHGQIPEALVFRALGNGRVVFPGKPGGALVQSGRWGGDRRFWDGVAGGEDRGVGKFTHACPTPRHFRLCELLALRLDSR